MEGLVEEGQATWGSGRGKKTTSLGSKGAREEKERGEHMCEEENKQCLFGGQRRKGVENMRVEFMRNGDLT